MHADTSTWLSSSPYKGKRAANIEWIWRQHGFWRLSPQCSIIWPNRLTCLYVLVSVCPSSVCVDSQKAAFPDGKGAECFLRAETITVLHIMIFSWVSTMPETTDSLKMFNKWINCDTAPSHSCKTEIQEICNFLKIDELLDSTNNLLSVYHML